MSLVAEVRRLAGAGKDEYLIDGVPYWSDAQIEQLLIDAARAHVHVELSLIADPTTGSWSSNVTHARVPLNGAIDVTDGGAIVDRDGTEIVADDWTIDRSGLIAFDEDVAGAAPLYWAGTVHDPAAAAAEVLEGWASAVKLGYDVKMDGQELTRSQMFDHLSKLAERMRSLSIGGGAGGVKSLPTRAEL